MENKENHNQVSLVSHRPWKSLCDSHIPTAPIPAFVLYRNQNPKKGAQPRPSLTLPFRLIPGLENADSGGKLRKFILAAV